MMVCKRYSPFKYGLFGRKVKELGGMMRFCAAGNNEYKGDED